MAEAPPVILEKGNEHYEIGKNLDIFEDKTGKLNISDVSSPKWSKKFKKSLSLTPNFGISKSTFWARFRVKNFDSKKKLNDSCIFNFISYFLRVG